MNTVKRDLELEFYEDDMKRQLLRSAVREYGDVSGAEEQSIISGINRLSDDEVGQILQTEVLNDEDDVDGWNNAFTNNEDLSGSDREMFIRLAAATIKAVNNLAPESDEEEEPEEDEEEMEGAGVRDGMVMPVNYNHGSIPFGDFF
jgi:hypothetical protein